MRININEIGSEIYLKVGRYEIYILGGYGVKLNQFTISIRNKESKKLIDCEKAFWRIQKHKFSKRAIRFFVVDVSIEGNYEIIFKNPKSLKLKTSNLPISSLFDAPLSTDNIEVYLTN